MKLMITGISIKVYLIFFFKEAFLNMTCILKVLIIQRLVVVIRRLHNVNKNKLLTNCPYIPL